MHRDNWTLLFTVHEIFVKYTKYSSSDTGTWHIVSRFQFFVFKKQHNSPTSIDIFPRYATAHQYNKSISQEYDVDAYYGKRKNKWRMRAGR